MEDASNRRMRFTNERSQAKMAVGSDLLDGIFQQRGGRESRESLDSERTGASHVHSAARNQSAANHVGRSTVGCNLNSQGRKMGLWQQQLRTLS